MSQSSSPSSPSAGAPTNSEAPRNAVVPLGRLVTAVADARGPDRVARRREGAAVDGVGVVEGLRGYQVSKVSTTPSGLKSGLGLLVRLLW